MEMKGGWGVLYRIKMIELGTITKRVLPVYQSDCDAWKEERNKEASRMTTLEYRIHWLHWRSCHGGNAMYQDTSSLFIHLFYFQGNFVC